MGFVREELLLHVGGDFELGFSAPLGLRLLANHCDHALVIPRLLDEIASPAAHRFHRQIDAAPGGHHHHRGSVAVRLQAGQQIQPFGAGRGVARIVEVGHDQVEGLVAQGAQQRTGRVDRHGLAALAFEQQPHGFQNIRLIVANQYPDRLRCWDGSTGRLHHTHHHIRRSQSTFCA